MIYIMNSISAAAGQSDIVAIAGSNVPGLALGTLGAAAGARCGGRLSRAVTPDVAATGSWLLA